MNWRQWKLGLLVALLSGLAGGAVGLVLGLTRNQIIILFVVNIGKDLGLFLKSHPADQVTFDTTHLTKTETTETTVKTPSVTTTK